jgi:hypothetical protein
MERPAAERYLLTLQDRVYRDALGARRAQPRAEDWAYDYSGRPTAFLGELIGPQWHDDDWLAWRTFIKAVFVEPLTTAGEHRIFQRCTNLSTPPTTRPPSVWMPIGRRGGKSRILAAIAVYLAMCFDWSHYLDPGEIGVIPVLAMDRRQARTIMSYVKAFVAHDKLKARVVAESAESIVLKGNLLIEVVTASFRAVRSRTVLAALCDELAFWRSEESSLNPDREIIAALEPAMATIPNALLLGASSPYARRGVLWENYDRYYGRTGGPLIWKAATRVMNPTVPQAFIDAKYAEDPVAARAEYGAEFRVDVDAFLTREVLDDAVVREVRELPPMPQTIKYRAFVDPSGGSSDSMTLAIGHVDKESKRGVVDVVRERRPPFSPEAVVTEFAELLRLYRVFRVKGDHYGGEWPRERFRIAGIDYQVADKRKSDIYLEFLPLLNAGRVQLIDDRRLYDQLLTLERRTARGGHESIDHPPHAHDDLANVVAGVIVDLLAKRQMLDVDPSVLARSLVFNRPSLDRLAEPGPRW